MDESSRAIVDEVAQLLAGASSALFITGAGISADSGLPTYRGIGGLYEEELTEDGVPIEEALSGSMFRRDPALTWKYIRRIEEACRGAEPNAAHRRIADLERRLDRVWVLTQNVDGLHRRGGSEQVIRIHGDVHDLRCTQCDWTEVVEDYAHLPAAPTCPQCGAIVRPEVVLFGEMLPQRALADLYRELERGFDVVFSVGTSSLFPYIAAPVVEARRSGRPAIEINPTDTEVTGICTHKLPEGAADALEALWAALEPQ